MVKQDPRILNKCPNEFAVLSDMLFPPWFNVTMVHAALVHVAMIHHHVTMVPMHPS